VKKIVFRDDCRFDYGSVPFLASSTQLVKKFRSGSIVNTIFLRRAGNDSLGHPVAIRHVPYVESGTELEPPFPPGDHADKVQSPSGPIGIPGRTAIQLLNASAQVREAFFLFSVRI
jgi:hypothetical protein